jgi:prevent-host-death family protein
MTLSLTEDFKTVEELEKQPKAILQQIQRTGRPVVVTKEGKPHVVILDAATYEKELHSVTLAKLLAEGEADIRAGRVRPAKEFLGELNVAKPSLTRRARKKHQQP